MHNMTYFRRYVDFKFIILSICWFGLVSGVYVVRTSNESNV